MGSYLSDSSGFLAHSGINRRKRMSSMASSATSDNENVTSIPYWVKEVQQPMVWSPHDNKFLVLDPSYKEGRDGDYYPPLSEEESEDETEEAEEVEVLKKEADEP